MQCSTARRRCGGSLDNAKVGGHITSKTGQSLTVMQACMYTMPGIRYGTTACMKSQSLRLHFMSKRSGCQADHAQQIQSALERQDLFRMHLAHHELESVVVIIRFNQSCQPHQMPIVTVLLLNSLRVLFVFLTLLSSF